MTDLATLDLRVRSHEVGRARDELGRFVAQGDRAEKSARRLAGASGSLGQSLGGVLRVLAPATAGLLGFRRALGVLTDFEDGLVGVSKTTNLAGRDLVELEGRIEGLATGLSTPVSGLLGITEAAGQLGVRGVPNLVAFTDTIAKLGDAAPSLSGDLDATALSTAKLLAITGEGTENVGRFASVVVRLGNEFETTENKVLNTGLEVAKAGASFGVAADDAVGLAAGFDRIGVEAELARSTVVQVFGKMSTAIDKGGDSLELFAALAGETADEFAAGFRVDAAGSFVEFIEGLSLAGAESGRVLEALGLTGLRVKPVLGGLAASADSLRDVLETANEEFELGTALEDEFARGSDKLSAALGRARNTLAILTDNLLDDSTGLAGGLRAVVELGTDATRILAGLEVQNDDTRETAELLAHGLQGVAAGLGTIIALRAATHIYGIAEAFGAATKSAAGLSAILATNPVGLAAVAVGGAVIAYQEFKHETIEIGKETISLQDVVLGAWDTFIDRLEAWKDTFVRVFDVAYTVGTATPRAVYSAFRTVFFDPIDESLDALGVSWSDLFGGILSVAKRTINVVIGLTLGWADIMSNLTRRVLDNFTAIAGIDFSSPLSSILGVAEQIRKNLDVEEFVIESGLALRESLDRDYIGALVAEVKEKGPTLAGVMREALGRVFGSDAAQDLLLTVNPIKFVDAWFDNMEERARDRRNTVKGVFSVEPPPADTAARSDAFFLLATETGPRELAQHEEELRIQGRMNRELEIRNQLLGEAGKEFDTLATAPVRMFEDLQAAYEDSFLSEDERGLRGAVRGFAEEFEAAFGQAGALGFLDEFEQRFADLQFREKIKEASDAVSREFGAALNSVFQDFDNLEDSLDRLRRGVTGIALDRLVTQPLEEQLSKGLSNVLGDVAGVGDGSEIRFQTAVTQFQAAVTAFVAGSSVDTASAGVSVATAFGAGQSGGGGAEANALGNVYFARGGLSRFAGDLLTRRTAFPLGIAGEAGPEAIMPASQQGGSFGVTGVAGGRQGFVPLTRDGSGALAVNLGAGGGAAAPQQTTHVTVIQHITTQDANSFRRSARQIQNDMRRGMNSRR